MKAAAFELDVPATIAQAARAGEARFLAGGQSLGPMLNLRLARPSRMMSIARLPDLLQVEARADTLTIGAAITHAAIEDGLLPAFADGLLARIAGGIAYRAVRTRGTIGGSLCHADPAADWLCTLTALRAEVLIWAADGGRAVPLPGFVTGAFRTVLRPGEIVQAVRIPRPSAGARWGYVKACRKPGAFAHAMAAVLVDGAHRRAVIGAVGGAPVVLEAAQAVPEAVDQALSASGLDAVTRHMQAVVLQRALQQAGA